MIKYPISYVSHVNQPLTKDHMPYKTTIGLHIGISLITGSTVMIAFVWEAIKSYVTAHVRIQTNLLVCAMAHLVNLLLSINMHVMHLCDM